MSQTHRPGLHDPVYRGSGSSAEPPDPQERLKQLQSELAQHNLRIGHLNAQAAALQADITGLQTTVQQVQATVTTYGAGLQDLQSRLQALLYFYDQKSMMVLAAIGDRKGPIDDLIRDFDHEVDRMRDRVRELGEMQAAAQEESAEAASAETARQNEYNKVTGYQADVTGKLTDMEGLRAQITQADDNTDVASMYLLLLEFHHRLRETEVISQHQLSLELRHTLGELEAAKEKARAMATASSNVQADYTNHQNALESKQQNRRATLLTAVQTMYPVPAASTPGGTTTSAGTAGTNASSAGASSASPATPNIAAPGLSAQKK